MGQSFQCATREGCFVEGWVVLRDNIVLEPNIPLYPQHKQLGCQDVVHPLPPLALYWMLEVLHSRNAIRCPLVVALSYQTSAE